MKQITKTNIKTIFSIPQICNELDLSIQIETTTDPLFPKVSLKEDGETYTITVNTATLQKDDYNTWIGYNVRKILLPRLKLETDRLILRRYLPEDAKQCFSFLSNEEDAYMDCCKAFSAMDEEYYNRVALFGERETQYMIILKENSELIGTVNVFPDDSRAVDAMEIGYSVSHLHQRKGYATEALSALLHLLQDELYLDIVTAGILPENIASEKLLLKLGFHKEGVRHKAVWHEGLDKPVDLIYYYRDRTET